MDQNSQNIALIKNLGTARPTLSFNFIFDFLGHFSIRCIYYFSKKVLIILRWNTKHVEYWLGVHFPLNKIYKAIDIDMLKFHKWGYALCPLEAWTLELIFSTFPSGDLQVLYQLTCQSFRRSANLLLVAIVTTQDLWLAWIILEEMVVGLYLQRFIWIWLIMLRSVGNSMPWSPCCVFWKEVE